MNNVVEIKKLSKSIGKRILFDNFNLDFQVNKKYAIKAPSGYGKSTLLNLIAGFIYPDSGEIKIFNITLNDSNIKDLRKKICMLPQLESTNAENTVLETIMKPFEFESNKHIKPKEETIFELLDKTNLDEKILTEKFNKISGGEKQRINLITCKLLNRELILLDEPSSALDEKSTAMVTDMLFDDRTAVIAASHDKNFLDKCDYIYDLKETGIGTN
jgi:putative ABC transport system ATP-binding protein